MVFDRYEIHIQAFLYFINGNEAFVNPHLHQKYFKKYILNLCFNKMSNASKHVFQKMMEIDKHKICRFSNMQNNTFKDDSIIFLTFVEPLW